MQKSPTRTVCSIHTEPHETQEFKAQQPKYAAECLNYENLWKVTFQAIQLSEFCGGAGQTSSRSLVCSKHTVGQGRLGDIQRRGGPSVPRFSHGSETMLRKALQAHCIFDNFNKADYGHSANPPKLSLQAQGVWAYSALAFSRVGGSFSEFVSKDEEVQTTSKLEADPSTKAHSSVLSVVSS